MVVVKTGKTDDGVRAARSHTASLAGNYDAFDAVCRAHGVVLVDDPVTMIRVADLLLRYPAVADGVGILSGSGGGTGIMVDRITGARMRLARLSPATRAALGELLLPPQANNPVDLGGRLPTAPDDVAGPAIRALAADPDVGVVLLYLTSMPGFETRTRKLARAALDSGKPVLAVMLPGPAGARPRAVLRELDCPYFDSVEDLLASLRGMFDHYHAAPASDAPHRPTDLPASLPSLRDPSKLVATYGIAVPQTIGCETLHQAISAASIIGFPVVLKGNVTGMTHKSELQAVKLGLKSVADIEAAWREIAASVDAHNLADAFSGCIVQEQVVPGVELLASIRRDPQFGPVLLVGAGGTMVELLHDLASAPAPVTYNTALRMLGRLRIARMLDAWRGNPARDIDAVANALVRLSWLAADLGDRLIDLEINPLITGHVGAGVRAVDVRAEWVREQEDSPLLPHRVVG
jgi:acetyl-CoA synthetase (ADP-forming)